jgi:predicted cobalt transporter CbtA
MTRYLRLGAIAGAAGGVALALVLRLLGEKSIGDAIAIEKAHAHGGTAPDELFSRGTQQLGGMAAAVIYGVAIGLVFAVVFAAVRHRLSTRNDWRRSTMLAAVGFATVFVVPFLKYPPNPPAVGDPDTITERTVLYVVLLAWSVIATWASWRTLRWLRARGVDEHTRGALTALTYVVLLAVAFVALPGTPDAVTAPATLVWRFRLATLAGAAANWSVLGAVFGWLCLRAARPTVALSDVEQAQRL